MTKLKGAAVEEQAVARPVARETSRSSSSQPSQPPLAASSPARGNPAPAVTLRPRAHSGVVVSDGLAQDVLRLDPRQRSAGVVLSGYESREEVGFGWPSEMLAYAGRWVEGYEDGERDGEPVATIVLAYSNEQVLALPAHAPTSRLEIAGTQRAFDLYCRVRKAAEVGIFLHSPLVDAVVQHTCRLYLEQMLRAWQVVLVRADGSRTAPRFTNAANPGRVALAWMRGSRGAALLDHFPAVEIERVVGDEHSLDADGQIGIQAYAVWVSGVVGDDERRVYRVWAEDSRGAAEEAVLLLVQQGSKLQEGVFQVVELTDRNGLSLVHFYAQDFPQQYAQLVGRPYRRVAPATTQAIRLADEDSSLIGRAVQAELQGDESRRRKLWHTVLGRLKQGVVAVGHWVRPQVESGVGDGI